MIEIGKLAQVYGRRNGYVICEDLLEDQRHVSVVLNYDNPYQVEGILASYGYRAYEDRGLIYWCGSSDPFAGASVQLVANNARWGPVIEISSNGASSRHSLASVASHNDLVVTFENCAYQLRRRNGRVVRYLSDQACLAGISRQAEAPAPTPKPQEASQAPTQHQAARPAAQHPSRPQEAVYRPSIVSANGPATASAAIAQAANAGVIDPAYRTLH